MYTIAFSGSFTSIPYNLASSIRLVIGQGIEVVQLTDFRTPKIIGVTKVHRLLVSPEVMVARLQAYGQVTSSNSSTFFCDADSIFINPLDLKLNNGDFLVTKKIKDGLVNYKYPEFYPEFKGKMFFSFPLGSGLIESK
ncbi:hypothetical protein N9I33_01985 [Paracoccaceae bacterium]|nr:hypothetical protein [Paracoccaceae bacterium]